MGTWDVSAFDNDTAADWAGSFEDLDREAGLELVEEALRAVIDEEDYLDSDFATEALAACELLARLGPGGGVASAYSEEVDAWVARNSGRPDAALVAIALKAIDRILAPSSELVALWEGDEKWLASVADLRGRVAAAA